MPSSSPRHHANASYATTRQQPEVLARRRRVPACLLPGLIVAAADCSSCRAGRRAYLTSETLQKLLIACLPWPCTRVHDGVGGARARAGLQAQAVPSSLPGFLDSCWLTMHGRMCSWILSTSASIIHIARSSQPCPCTPMHRDYGDDSAPRREHG
jgi:hypothetical protein